MLVSLFTIITGLLASKEERGRALGFIGMSNGLGSIVGGASVGLIVDWRGYPTMFTTLCLFSLALLVSVIFIKDKKIEQVPGKSTSTRVEKPRFGKAFFVLLLAQMVAMGAASVAMLGRSISMNSLGFTTAAVTSTMVISGLVSLPFPFLLGWLSDRVGRKRMMVISYVSMGLCVIMLAVSTSLWHFWIAIIFLKLGLVSINVGPAFVADLVEPKALGRGASLFLSAHTIAIMIGFMVGGKAFQDFGIAPTSFFSTALPVIGIILIMLIRVKQQEEVIAR
jgi:predicted MFS family arabinose efflux permease